jgi:hypothetical protein
MERIEDQNLERRTLGIVTLSQPGWAKAGYHHVPRLFDALALARGDRRHARLLKTIARSNSSFLTIGASPM